MGIILRLSYPARREEGDIVGFGAKVAFASRTAEVSLSLPCAVSLPSLSVPPFHTDTAHTRTTTHTLRLEQAGRRADKAGGLG